MQANEFSITVKDLIFAYATTSPGLSEYDGIFTISPFRVMCLCDTNWRAALRVGAIPIRYTTLSRRDSHSCKSTSPVTCLLLFAFSYKLWNCFSKLEFGFAHRAIDNAKKHQEEKKTRLNHHEWVRF